MSKGTLTPDWTIDLTEAILATYATTDFRSWLPFSADRLTPYYYAPMVRRLSGAISRIRSSGEPMDRVARKFPHLNHFRDELDALVAYWGHGDLQVPVEDVSNVVLFLAEAFTVLCPDDPFSRQGKFGRISGERATQITDAAAWKAANTSNARELGKLIVSANALAYALYTDVWPGAVGDIYHGPYRLKTGEQLIVREYLELAPHQLWPDVRDWGVKQIRILTCYRPEAKLFVDFYCNLKSASSLIEDLSRFALSIDGSSVEEQELPNAYAELGKFAVAQYETLRSLEFEAMKRRFMEAHCYSNKCLFDAAGLDWRPTHEMYQLINGRSLLPEIDAWQDATEARNIYKKALTQIARHYKY